ncbi:MAG: stage III sporulation protein AA [Clostridiales bacterium]|nr:stage III sporulation protein AA [Clostridiales bacterium]
MNAFLKAISYFDYEEQMALLPYADQGISQISVGVGKKCTIFRFGDVGHEETGEIYTQSRLLSLLSRMLEHSPYAWEDELGRGYFPLAGGIRVGVTGRFSKDNEKTRLVLPTGLLIRIPREIRGCAHTLVRLMEENGFLSGAMILSPPGMGKTTMLRDACRLISDKRTVCVVDERCEIAALYEGRAQFDIGKRAHVCEGLSKAEACMMLIRSMSPDVIVMDEIGSAEDAEAIFDASRMGVSVLASAHAASLDDALSRRMLSNAMNAGAFGWACVLGPSVGKINHLYAFSEGKWLQKSL